MSCECGLAGIGNSGYSSNLTIKKPVGLIFLKKYANDGTRNGIDVNSVTFDQAYLDGQYNQTDWSKRWFPYMGLKGSAITVADSTFDEAADGTKYFVKDGVISFTGDLYKAPNQLLCKLASMRCHDVVAYIVDECGSLFGGSFDKENGMLYGISLESQTINAFFNFATDSTVEKISLSFDFKTDAKICAIAGIPNTSITGDLLGSRGLVSVNASVVNALETGATVSYTGEYGNVLDCSAALGMDISNFTLTEISPTPGVVAITSVNESADGVYDVVATLASGGVYELVAVLDYHEIAVATITVP